MIIFRKDKHIFMVIILKDKVTIRKYKHIGHIVIIINWERKTPWTHNHSNSSERQKHWTTSHYNSGKEKHIGHIVIIIIWNDKHLGHIVKM